MSANPVYSKIYPLDDESFVKGYEWGVKILDYEGLNERLDRQVELRSLEEAEQHQKRFEDGKKPHRETPRFEIVEVSTDDYPQETWKVLKRYSVGTPPYYASVEEAAYYWGVISQYTEPFYVYCSPTNHRIPDFSDLDNEKSSYHDKDFVYRIEACDGEVEVIKCKAGITEEEKLLEGFNVEEDDIDEW